MDYLQCDAVGCDHRETVGVIEEKHVDMPCPKCGANLLTRTDYDVWSSQFKPMMEAMEDLGLTVQPVPGLVGKLTSIQYHDGVTTIRDLGRATPPHQEEGA